MHVWLNSRHMIMRQVYKMAAINIYDRVLELVNYNTLTYNWSSLVSWDMGTEC